VLHNPSLPIHCMMSLHLQVSATKTSKIHYVMRHMSHFEGRIDSSGTVQESDAMATSRECAFYSKSSLFFLRFRGSTPLLTLRLQRLTAATGARILKAAFKFVIVGDEPRSPVNNIEQALTPPGTLVIDPTPGLRVVTPTAAREASIAHFALSTLHFHGAVAPLRLLLVGVAPRPVLPLLEALVELLVLISAREVTHRSRGGVAACDGNRNLTEAPAARVSGHVAPRRILANAGARVVRHRLVNKREMASVPAL
jgi:hypothetical protein